MASDKINNVVKWQVVTGAFYYLLKHNHYLSNEAFVSTWSVFYLL